MPLRGNSLVSQISQICKYYNFDKYNSNNKKVIFMQEVYEGLINFQKERDWKKFHTPENLAKSISIEAAELLEHFQWQKEFDKSEVADELADVLIYCIYMADAMDFDIKEIILNKMEKNALKYPVDKSRGNAKKYDEL